jgi:hypothetical protein
MYDFTIRSLLNFLIHEENVPQFFISVRCRGGGAQGFKPHVTKNNFAIFAKMQLFLNYAYVCNNVGLFFLKSVILFASFDQIFGKSQ